MSLTIKTNNVPRFTIDAYELTAKEREEFDYLNWEAIDAGEDSATFFRYKGNVYDLGEFMRIEHHPDEQFGKWDGYASDSAFSGVLVKYYGDNCESVIVATYYS